MIVKAVVPACRIVDNIEIVAGIGVIAYPEGRTIEKSAFHHALIVVFGDLACGERVMVDADIVHGAVEVVPLPRLVACRPDQKALLVRSQDPCLISSCLVTACLIIAGEHPRIDRYPVRVNRPVQPLIDHSGVIPPASLHRKGLSTVPALVGFRVILEVTIDHGGLIEVPLAVQNVRTVLAVPPEPDGYGK